MKRLRDLVIAGTLILASLLPFKLANAQTTESNVFNSFVRPNVNSTNYYGSGDANDDGKVDEADLDLLGKGLENDFTNVCGDRGTRELDYQILENHLNNGTILPGDWNNLQTREQREDWFKKMLKIDKTDEKQYILDVWDCHHFATQTHLNFLGYDKEVSETFDTKNLARFNLPVYFVSVYNPEGFEQSGSDGHNINCILTGDNPLNFNDWDFFEPQNDKPINIGDWNIPENSKISIATIREFFPGSDIFRAYRLVKYELDEDKPKLDEDSINPDLVLTRDNPSAVEEDIKPTKLEKILRQNYPNPTNGSTTIEYTLPKSGNVKFAVYNILGQPVEIPVNGYQEKGRHSVVLNGDNYDVSGTYIYKIEGESFKDSKKMMVVK